MWKGTCPRKLIFPKDGWEKSLTFIQRSLLEYNFLFLLRKLNVESRKTCALLKKHGFEFKDFSDENIVRLFYYMGSLKHSRRNRL